MQVLEMDTLMQDVLPSWPPRDEDGRPDNITIPEAQHTPNPQQELCCYPACPQYATPNPKALWEVNIHARFKLTSIVSIITHPEIEPFVYHLTGKENIHDIEAMGPQLPWLLEAWTHKHRPHPDGRIGCLNLSLNSTLKT